MYMYVYVYTYMYIYIYIYILSLSVYIYIYIYVHTYVYIYIYIYTHVYIDSIARPLRGRQVPGADHGPRGARPHGGHGRGGLPDLNRNNHKKYTTNKTNNNINKS